MWQIWVCDPSSNVGWMTFEDVRFERQARYRCEELAESGLKTAIRNTETGETVFEPSTSKYKF